MLNYIETLKLQSWVIIELKSLHRFHKEFCKTAVFKKSKEKSCFWYDSIPECKGEHLVIHYCWTTLKKFSHVFKTKKAKG